MNFNVCYSWPLPSLQQSESPALQLTGYCKLTRPTRLTFRTPKRHFLLLKGTMLSYYKEEDEFNRGHAPIQKLNLTGIYMYIQCALHNRYMDIHGYACMCTLGPTSLKLLHVSAVCLVCSAHLIPYTCMYIYLNL